MVALRLYFGDIIHTHSYPPPMWDGRRSTAVDPYVAPDSDSESDTGEYLLPPSYLPGTYPEHVSR